MPGVTCQVSCVRCQVSGVKCPVSGVIFSSSSFSGKVAEGLLSMGLTPSILYIKNLAYGSY